MKNEVETIARPGIRPEDLLRPNEIAPDHLRRLIAAVEKSKGRFVNWERLGRPAFDHRLIATVEVTPEALGDVIKGAVANDGLSIRFGGLINGLPPMDRVAVVNFEIAAR
jgi:hypothetical protein